MAHIGAERPEPLAGTLIFRTVRGGAAFMTETFPSALRRAV